MTIPSRCNYTAAFQLLLHLLADIFKRQGFPSTPLNVLVYLLNQPYLQERGKVFFNVGVSLITVLQTEPSQDA